MGDDQLFDGVFSIDAKLIDDMESVKGYFDKISHFKSGCSRIEELNYIIGIGGESKSLELKRNKIVLRFKYPDQNGKTSNANLITFLSMLKMLQQFYEISLDGIYGYIIDALDQNWGIGIKKEGVTSRDLMERIESLNNSNCNLANQVTLISRQKAKAVADYRIYREFCKNVAVSSKRNFKPDELSNFCRLLGIERDSLELIKNRLNLDI
jgi:hypothetical protein